MDLGLKGKVAIVAGSSRGIGKAVAMGLAAEGVSVTICSRDGKALNETAEEIRSATGSRVIAVPADVRRPEEVKKVVEATIKEFGALHILFNNAGGPPAGEFENMTDQNWDDAFNMNLMSAVRFIRECVPHMKKEGWGRIINLTSTSVKQPIEELILSNSLRMGVIGLAKTLSSKFAKDNITVNNVLPGRILTDRLKSIMAAKAEREGRSVDQVLEEGKGDIPMGRYGEPSEMADLVVFLASERASYITGVSIQVDGGLVKGVY